MVGRLGRPPPPEPPPQKSPPTAYSAPRWPPPRSRRRPGPGSSRWGRSGARSSPTCGRSSRRCRATAAATSTPTGSPAFCLLLLVLWVDSVYVCVHRPATRGRGVGGSIQSTPHSTKPPKSRPHLRTYKRPPPITNTSRIKKQATRSTDLDPGVPLPLLLRRKGRRRRLFFLPQVQEHPHRALLPLPAGSRRRGGGWPVWRCPAAAAANGGGGGNEGMGAAAGGREQERRRGKRRAAHG